MQGPAAVHNNTFHEKNSPFINQRSVRAWARLNENQNSRCETSSIVILYKPVFYKQFLKLPCCTGSKNADTAYERLSMAKVTSAARERLTAIITTDYEECQFFAASAQMLINKIKDFSERAQAQETTFEQLRDEIGQIGVFLGNAEKRLQEVEDCYTKLVECLSENIQHQ